MDIINKYLKLSKTTLYNYIAKDFSNKFYIQCIFQNLRVAYSIPLFISELISLIIYLYILFRKCIFFCFKVLLFQNAGYSPEMSRLCFEDFESSPVSLKHNPIGSCSKNYCKVHFTPVALRTKDEKNCYWF